MFNIMKKSLLLVAMSFAVSSMIAQSPFKVTKDAMVKSVESNLGVAPSYKTLEEGASNSHRSIATKLWYFLPQGATYLCWNKEGSGYGPSYVMVAPWKEFTFVNASENVYTPSTLSSKSLPMNLLLDLVLLPSPTALYGVFRRFRFAAHAQQRVFTYLL
jgi:hypothetical protein